MNVFEMPSSIVRTLSGAATAIVVGTGVLAAPSVAGAAEPADPLGARVSKFIEGIADWGFSGSAIVVRDGQIVAEVGAGVADPDSGRACSAASLYEIASSTKHFTAVAIHVLAEDGTLTLDDPVGRWLESWPEEHASVTIRHLVDHTSGFPRMGPTGSGRDAARAIADYVAGGRTSEPGTSFEYWNGGYALLAGIIEEASGRSFETFCRERLFVPAGMDDTGFCGEPRFAADRLTHGVMEGQSVGHAASRSYGWEYRGMGGMVTTVGDLARWESALSGGRILDSLEGIHAANEMGYGGGGWIESSPSGGVAHFIAGNVAGFNSAMWRFPDDDAFVAVLCNTPSNAFIVGLQLCRMAFGQADFIAMPPDRIELDAAVAAGLSGRFVGDEGIAVEVAWDGDRLQVVPEGQPAVQVMLAGTPEVPPHIVAATELATTLVDAMLKGRFEDLADVMDPDIPADWPERFATYWQETVGPRGPVESVEVLWVRPTAESPISKQAVIRLVQGDRETLVEQRWFGDRISAFTLDADPARLEARFVATAPRSFESYAIAPGPSTRLEFDDDRDRLTIIGIAGGRLALVREPDGDGR